MLTKKYQKEINLIENILKKASKELNNLSKKVVHDKNIYDLVTDNDIFIEKLIINEIKSEYPSDKILSEELNNETCINGRVWIIDPIDGTCNYANDIPLYGIQIALMVDNKTEAAGIILPKFNELYLAVNNEGCYMNGEKIKARPKEVNHCMVSFGDYNPKMKNEGEVQSEVMKNIKYKIMKEKMYGAASIDYAFCLSGRIDGTYLIGGCYWDFIPGLLMCKEANFFIDSPLTNKEDESKIIVIANNEELFKILKGIA